LIDADTHGSGQTRGGKAALAQLAAAGADAVLSGHVHDPFDMTIMPGAPDPHHRRGHAVGAGARHAAQLQPAGVESAGWAAGAGRHRKLIAPRGTQAQKRAEKPLFRIGSCRSD
jgi:hypothetical protein